MSEPLFEEEPKIDVEIKEIEEDVPVPEVPDIEETPVPKKRGRKKKVVVEEPVVVEPMPIKKERKKRVLTDEQKEKLRENLKRGRETSLANRQRKKKLKEIEKAEKVTAEDEKIFENLKRKMKPKELENENERLKKELAELRSAKTVKVVEPAKVVEEKKEVVKPLAVAVKPKAKVMTNRQKMRMLKGL